MDFVQPRNVPAVHCPFFGLTLISSIQMYPSPFVPDLVRPAMRSLSAPISKLPAEPLIIIRTQLPTVASDPLPHLCVERGAGLAECVACAGGGLVGGVMLHIWLDMRRATEERGVT